MVITALHRFSDDFTRVIESCWLRGGPFEARWKALIQVLVRGLDRTGFSLGCPVAATALDLEDGDKRIRRVVDAILAHWTEVVARGLPDLIEPTRRAFAESMLATVEGALLLARAQQDVGPLLRAQNFVLAAYTQAAK